MAAYCGAGFMTHVTCRLTAQNWDQLRNPALGNWVWTTFTFYHSCTWTPSTLAQLVFAGCVTEAGSRYVMWSVLLRLLQDEDEPVRSVAAQSVGVLLTTRPDDSQSTTGKYHKLSHCRGKTTTLTTVIWVRYSEYSTFRLKRHSSEGKMISFGTVFTFFARLVSCWPGLATD